ILTKPTTDKWGTWISVLTPIKDPTTGKIIAVMGIDYAANEWFNSAKSAAIQGAIMLIAVFLFFISIFFIIKKNRKLSNSIDQLIETEKELIESKEQAEAASIAKSHFLSNMSHEIRTPLNGVIGFTELLRNTPLNKNQKDYLENAIISANSLLGVINDILDFSKIESGKMELEQVKTDVINLIENAADIIKIMAAKKGLELLLNVQPNLPRYIYIDPIRTKQILINLLSNAVKFTHAGEVELKVSFDEKTKKTGRICISVRDTGIGIKEADKKKLFKAFSQADTSTTRRYGGTGLGLIISNSLAEKMGSKIEFESILGVGTTFTFSFETGYEYGEEKVQNSFDIVKSVLVVDDNLNNRIILEETFRYWGIEFTGAESGQEALDKLDKGEKFDLLIIDYHMPDMNGMDTIKLIREKLADTNNNQPIMMLHSSSDDIALYDLAKKYNVKFMLTKPIKQDELYQYLCNLQHIDSTIEIEKVTPSTINDVEPDYNRYTKYPFKVLITEDTPMNMLVISNMIKNILPNVILSEAKNGYESIDSIKLAIPDLVLMDVQMPELDGIEATKAIRKMENGILVPIIALTAGVSKEEREACYVAGMNDFLAKPIEANELSRVIYKYLLHNNTTIGEKGDTELVIHFDKVKLLSKIGNKETMQTILEMSKLEYPKYVSEIQNAINENNVELIKRCAHKLKGSAQNLEFNYLGEIANLIEKNADNNIKLQDLSNVLSIELSLINKLIN
ncbi:MAG: response regulator, partial [Paludibacter sp.]